MALGDKLVGLALMGVSLAVFVYYSLWVVVTPFLEPSHWLQALFLDRFYAVAIPAGLILALVVFVFAFVSSVLAKSAKKKSS